MVKQDGVAADPEKTERVASWPVPTNPADLRSFLGFASYYRRFIKDFAKIASPLHRLTEKKTEYRWSEEADDAFRELKRRLVSAPILAYPRYSDPFILDTDASDRGIGAVLSQIQDGKERVIGYGSRTLTKAERNYCVTRRVMLAVVTFTRHFRCYLLGRPFVVRTDHAALQWLQRFKEPEGQVARVEQLREYHFQAEHRPGTRHSNADALSRRPCDQCGDPHNVDAVHMSLPEGGASGESSDDGTLTPILTTIQSAQEGDPQLGPIRRRLLAGKDRPTVEEMSGSGLRNRGYWAQWDQLFLENGVVHRHWEDRNGKRILKQMVVPRELVPVVIKELHDGVAGGHLGVTKTVGKARERFYWIGLREDIELWCRQCPECAKRKSPARPNRASLVPVRTGFPMERVALDIVGPLPITQHGNKYILVVSDYFTRWPEAYPLANQEAESIARVLVNEWICRFGVPMHIHSDQGRNFESKIFKKMYNLLGMAKTRTTPYHPQSDGLVERFNRTLIGMLSIRVAEDETSWDDHLPATMLAYRSSVQESTGYTPFHLMFGREIRLPIDLMFGRDPDPMKETTEYVVQLKQHLEEAYEQVRKRTGFVQGRQKDRYDQRAVGGQYNVGDRVWLHNPAVKRGLKPKFHRPLADPFVVVKRITCRCGVSYPARGDKSSFSGSL